MSIHNEQHKIAMKCADLRDMMGEIFDLKNEIQKIEQELNGEVKAIRFTSLKDNILEEKQGKLKELEDEFWQGIKYVVSSIPEDRYVIIETLEDQPWWRVKWDQYVSGRLYFSLDEWQIKNWENSFTYSKEL